MSGLPGAGRVVACLCFLSLCSGVRVAAEDMSYSLGTVQYEEELEVVAGQELHTSLCFYNVDGSAPATVRVVVQEVPAGWDIGFSRPEDGGPPQPADSVSLSVPVTEVQIDGADCGATQKAVYLPGRGYACTEAVDVIVRVPHDESERADVRLTVVSTVDWDVPGAPSQERTFDYVVSVLPADDEVPTPGSFRGALAGLVLVLVLSAIYVRTRLAKQPSL